MVRHAGIVLVIGLTALAAPARDVGPSSIPERAKVFRCTPRDAALGDKVRIRVSSPHGTDFGLKDPSHNFHFIYSCDENIRSPSFKALDCERFAQMKEVVIDTSTFRALDESGKPVHVFAEPGSYSFYLGRNLETENTGATLNICSINLRALKK